MAQEIERKFLVTDTSYRDLAVKKHSIRQAYLSCRPEATVRVRIINNKAFLTVKGSTCGCSRSEWEYPIPPADAIDMLSLADSNTVIISKTRYIVPAGTLKWEIDEFHGVHEGLTIAEIELTAEDEDFALPPFIGREVTGEPFYYNSNLSTLTND